MHNIVDPKPLHDEHRAALRAEYEPRIAALEAELQDATAPATEALQQQLRSLRREYRKARWSARLLRRGPLHW